jgi:hypothetical protein
MLRSRALRHVALIVSAVASASCGDYTGSTGPAAVGYSTIVPTKTVISSFATLSEQARATAVRWASFHARDQRASALIGPEGGTIALPGSDFTMNIPEGALSAPTMITVTSVAGYHVTYDMQPHGLQFMKPVTAVQHLANTAAYRTPDAPSIRSAYLSERNDQIAPDGTAAPAELQAATTLFYGAEPVAETHVWTLTHFSRWILISGVVTLVNSDG